MIANRPTWRIGSPMIAFTAMEIETLIGYLGELLDSEDTPDKDMKVLSALYSRFVGRLG